jgi:hypothetical protein
MNASFKQRNEVLVWLGYVILTLLLTYPLILRLGTHVAGNGDDMWIFQWDNWWVKKAWTEGLDLYHTSYMFHPQGAPLYFHSFSWFNTFLWLLLEPLVGAIAAHNTAVLFAYVLSCFTMYLLALEVTNSRWAAFLAGIVFAFFPYRNRQINHPHLFNIQWIPLAVLYVVRLIRTGSLRYAIGIGVALALCALSGWQLLLLVGLWTAVWLVCYVLSPNPPLSLQQLAGFALACFICILLVAPLLWPLVVNGLSPEGENLEPPSVQRSSDLMAYFLPNRHHTLVKTEAGGKLYNRFVHTKHKNTALGYVVLGLMIWAVLKRRREALPWVSTAFVFWVLALGSVLKINGRTFPGIPLPYRLLEPTILGQVLRFPPRFNIILSLPVAVLTALGTADILGRWALRGRKRYIITGCLVLFLILEYTVVPFPTRAPVRSNFYRELQYQRGSFAVANVPLDYTGHNKYYMYTQTLHEHPMVGGHISRVPDQIYAFIEKTPILVTALAGAPQEKTLDDVSQQLSPLVDANVRYTLIHKHRDPQVAEVWREWFAIQPYYEDKNLLVFHTDPSYGRDFEFLGTVNEHIGVITATVYPHVLPQEGLINAQIVWGTREAPNLNWNANLALVSSDGEQVQQTTFEPCIDWPTSQWGQDAIARGYGALQVDPYIRQGTYTVTVSLVGPGTGARTNKSMAIGHVDVQAIERVFEVPAMETEVGARFGDVFHLLGYDWHQVTDQLTVTLHWRARRRMDTSYKFFVHLIDAESVQVVSQADVIPHDWTYPTTWWEEGEVVSDDIVLTLEDAPSGAYRLAIGVYHPGSGERLPVTQGQEQLSKNQLILRDVQITN